MCVVDTFVATALSMYQKMQTFAPYAMRYSTLDIKKKIKQTAKVNKCRYCVRVVYNKHKVLCMYYDETFQLNVIVNRCASNSGYGSMSLLMSTVYTHEQRQ